MKKITREDLEKINSLPRKETGNYIRVGMSTCGIAAGADEVFITLVEEAKKRNLPIEVKKCGCVGMCFAEPLVEVAVDGLPPVIYGKVNKEIAIKILEKHVAGKILVNEYIFDLKVKE
jgi:NADP-reducing hydrogenase subunit HndB